VSSLATGENDGGRGKLPCVPLLARSVECRLVGGERLFDDPLPGAKLRDPLGGRLAQSPAQLGLREQALDRGTERAGGPLTEPSCRLLTV
jgi:hypothetical protein